MTNLFKKAAVFTDLHVGLKSNSTMHNNDCLEFVNWFVEKAKEENCDTCFFLGDWHHHRASINMQTLSYSVRLLEKLNNSFEKVYVIPGNHDQFYRDKRDIHSVEWAKHLPNVNIINDWFISDDVVITPWLVGDEYKRLSKINAKYMFGHLELPRFYMNSQIAMPDHGEINEDHLGGFETVFSGHFHKRQNRKNIWYIGNAFPHNYADAGDDQRGMMILEWGQDPVFYSWPGQPLYRVYKLSDVLDAPDKLLLPKSNVRVHLDIDISFEEANFIRETLMPKYNIREMSLIPIKLDQHSQDLAPGELKFESVDQIIVDQLGAIESEFFDPKLLLEIYKNL
jgi:DNA repair exonuclease SbcCD nuclease subunit